MAHKVSVDSIAKLQAQPIHLRNICILAHVDHGKTTLSDCLISANGIISSKLAGRVRYMDSTEDEQARGITMKSSSITLLHNDEPYRELRAKYAPQVEAHAAAVAAVEARAAAAVAEGTPLEPLPAPPKVPYLINLIDSPGHVDFSMDVATAARLCDGALVVVDALEGVCIQTHAVLRVAWSEGVRPALVINKVDRLITELQLTPHEAYLHLWRIVEACNVIIHELYTADLMKGLSDAAAAAAAAADAAAAAAAATAAGSSTGAETELAEGAAASAGDASTFGAWGVEADEKMEAQIYFDPAKGNVVFASAFDGWACTLDDFAKLHYRKLGVSRSLLRRALWGNYYYKAKTGRIVTGAAAAAAAKGKPLAVSLFLERLWAVYDAFEVNPDEARASKIISILGLDIPPRELATKDPKSRLQAVMRAWLPVPDAVLGTVVRKLPSPREAQAARVDKLWPADQAGAADAAAALDASATLEQRLAVVRAGIAACDTSLQAPCVVFVSKMFAVPKASLPDLLGVYSGTASLVANAGSGGAAAAPPPLASSGPFAGTLDPSTLTAFPETMQGVPDAAWWGTGLQGGAGQGLDLSPVNSSARRRRAAAAAAARAAAGAEEGEGEASSSSSSAPAASPSAGEEAATEDDWDGEDANEAETFVAFARVLCGVLTPDTPVFVLGPRYDPRAPTADGCAHMSLVAAPMPLYMMMGRGLSPVKAAYAGNVVGIGRLGAHVLKTATLASTPACASLSPMTFQTTPLVRVAIEPVDARHLRAVERGLALLNQADPCVEVTTTEAGEMQLAALGELHLERCLKDLTTRFARVELRVSPPILSFMETITSQPKPEPLPAGLLEAGAGGGDGASEGSACGAAGGEGEGAASSLASPTAASGGGLVMSGPISSPATYALLPRPNLAAGTPAGAGYHPPSASVLATTPDRTVTLRLRAYPLPAALTEALQDPATAGSLKVLQAVAKSGSSSDAASVSSAATTQAHLLQRLTAAFTAKSTAAATATPGEEGVCDGGASVSLCSEALCAGIAPLSPADLASVLSFGPKRVGPNLLISRLTPARVHVLAGGSASGGPLSPTAGVSTLPNEVALPPEAVQAAIDAAMAGVLGGTAAASPASPSASSPLASSLAGVLTTVRAGAVQGFQLATGAGPLCAEPLWGVAIALEEVYLRGGVLPAADVAAPDAITGVSIPVASGQVISATRDAVRTSVLAGNPRLVEAFLRCELQCSSGRGGAAGEQLGKLYAVLARRRGRVIAEDTWEGTQTFLISALLPVVESFGFADDLRKKTSGAATTPQLVFSHWEVIPRDPFWVPTTEEEREEVGHTLHEGQCKNLARLYLDAVRERKGMPVDKKIVVHAEKQRTKKK